MASVELNPYSRVFSFHCPVEPSDFTIAFSLWSCRLNNSQVASLESAIEDAVLTFLRQNDISFDGIDYGKDVAK